MIRRKMDEHEPDCRLTAESMSDVATVSVACVYIERYVVLLALAARSDVLRHM